MTGHGMVQVLDTTLRDGEQSPGVSLGTAAKLEIARCLARLGVDAIEAGFPVASPGESAAVEAIAREVKGPVIVALARTHRKDIEAAAAVLRAAGRRRLHLFLSTSDIHLRHMMNMTRSRALAVAVESVRYARRQVEDVQFSAQDATRSDIGFLAEILAATVEAGATVINVPDTVGYTLPSEYRKLLETLRDRVPALERVILSTHTHDDLGLAVANALAAVEGGARQVECTINGIGERAGNCSLEEVVMGLVTRRDRLGCGTGINTRHLLRASRLVANLTGIPVQPNKAIVGANAFRHESGIHQDGVLKEPSTYEIIRPQDVGGEESHLVLGKHSGRHAFRAKLVKLGFELGPEELESAFKRFKELADRKPQVQDEDIEAIAGSQLTREPEICRLDYFLVTSGNHAIPTATVRLHCSGEVREHSACGNGPVDAVFRAVDGAIGRSHHLVEYRLRAVTGGTNALGEVTVQVELNGQTTYGRGLSSDVVEASVHAYVNAVNRHLRSAAAPGQDARTVEGVSP